MNDNYNDERVTNSLIFSPKYEIGDHLYIRYPTPDSIAQIVIGAISYNTYTGSYQYYASVPAISFPLQEEELYESQFELLETIEQEGEQYE